MTKPGEMPPKEEVRPSGLARLMVKYAMRASVREEGLAAFEDEFAERFAELKNLKEARSWALRTAWESLQDTYKPVIDLGMYFLAIMGVILAIVAIL